MCCKVSRKNTFEKTKTKLKLSTAGEEICNQGVGVGVVRMDQTVLTGLR